MYSQQVANAICERLAAGESLRAICRSEGMPAESTVRLWALENTEGFSAQYTRAREIGYDCLADELLAIADTPSLGRKVTTKPNGEKETVEGDMTDHRRIQIDARKWMLSKMLPKKYGDKLDLNHSGRIATSREMTEDELASIAAGSGG